MNKIKITHITEITPKEKIFSLANNIGSELLVTFKYMKYDNEWHCILDPNSSLVESEMEELLKLCKELNEGYK